MEELSQVVPPVVEESAPAAPSHDVVSTEIVGDMLKVVFADGSVKEFAL